VTVWPLLLLFLGVVLGAAIPLGRYTARVSTGRAPLLEPLLGPLERLLYRLAGVDAREEMTWPRYARAMLFFNAAGFAGLYLLERLQGFLPLDVLSAPGVPPFGAFDTAVSFVTNTNWQSYPPERVMSTLTQVAGLTVQNFLSAATGIAVLLALIRGLSGRGAGTVGNFWVDMVRTTLYLLLPLSLVLAVALVSQGVVQTFTHPIEAEMVDGSVSSPTGRSATQRIPVGPVASQVAIKQLGSNGGGFYNANSAHPFEDPTPLSGFLELAAILLLPVALCETFGVMVGDLRQGRALLAAMLVIFIPLALMGMTFEERGNPDLAPLGVDQATTAAQSGGNMEGKEVRFGPVFSALWAAATTATSNGSVDSMHDSFTPLGGLVPLALMQLGEVVFGGVGSGLYGMVLFVVVAVFAAGLMVGRTPSYLGKKIEPFEMKVATLALVVMPLVVLIGTAIAVVVPSARTGAFNPGPHGFSEILYAFSSAGNNNGSAFAGLDAATPFYTLVLGVVMIAGRYWIAIPVLALAGALAAKRPAPASAGTLPTHTPTFVLWLVAVVLIVGGLTFFPALALGPIAEHLLLP
jgi:K+-transporting ATPase ATPase A chain